MELLSNLPLGPPDLSRWPVEQMILGHVNLKCLPPVYVSVFKAGNMMDRTSLHCNQSLDLLPRKPVLRGAWLETPQRLVTLARCSVGTEKIDKEENRAIDAFFV